MSDNIKLITFGSQELADRTAQCVPVASHINMSTVNQFQGYFHQIDKVVFVVLLFFDSTDPILQPILIEMERRKDWLIGVFICSNSNGPFISDSRDRCYVSEFLIPYKIKSTISRFLESESIRQLELGYKEFGNALERERKIIMKQFSVNEQFRACHILFIPLNATPKNLHFAQQHLKYICYALYGDEYKFIIRTLSDYIPEDESDPDNRYNTAFLEKRYVGEICQTIIELSFMCMILVGDEPDIPNKWSQKLVATALDISQNQDLRHVNRCTFVIDRNVSDNFRENLVPIFGSTWPIQHAIAKTLVDVGNDIHFQNELQSIYPCLANREIVVNQKLRERSLAYSDDNSAFSSESHIIQPAQNGPEEKQDAGDINNNIAFL